MNKRFLKKHIRNFYRLFLLRGAEYEIRGQEVWRTGGKDIHGGWIKEVPYRVNNHFENLIKGYIVAKNDARTY